LQSRSSAGSIALTVNPAPSGKCCTHGVCSIASQYNCTQGGGAYGGDGTNCGTVSYTIASGGSPYVDISTTGTIAATVSNVDDGTQSVALPFSFTLFDTAYTSVWISSNGNLQFGATSSTTYINDAIPSTATPNAAIYTLWDDYNTIDTGAPNGQGDIFYQTDGVAPNRTFTVEWHNVTQYTAAGTYPMTSETFEAVLFEGSNNIEFRYGTITPTLTGNTGQGTYVDATGGDRTIGVENAAGTVAYSYPSIGLAANTSLLVTYTLPPNACPPTCGSADFNCDGDTGTDADIEAFFRCLAGTCPGGTCPSNADFNADGDTGTDADIEAFFRVLAGGNC
jgi:hypothetical protein